MIKGNRIYFGYGTVAVNHKIGKLILSEIKPPQKIGKDISQNKEIKRLKQIIIEATNKELDKLLEKIDNIKSNKVIKFKGYILDFNKYDEESVFVLWKKTLAAQGIWYMSLAC